MIARKTLATLLLMASLPLIGALPFTDGGVGAFTEAAGKRRSQPSAYGTEPDTVRTTTTPPETYETYETYEASSQNLSFDGPRKEGTKKPTAEDAEPTAEDTTYTPAANETYQTSVETPEELPHEEAANDTCADECSEQLFRTSEYNGPRYGIIGISVCCVAIAAAAVTLVAHEAYRRRRLRNRVQNIASRSHDEEGCFRALAVVDIELAVVSKPISAFV